MLAESYYLDKGELKIKPKKYRLTFLTVTLPAKQAHTDQKIKSVVLNNFINKLRYHKKDLKYIWRAEPQENGNIHFHFILNLYVEMKLCDKLWHDSLELLGYVTAYEKKWKSRFPPTNRIEYVYTAKQIVGYATKYMTKIEDRRKIDGRNWYASQKLNAMIKGETHISREWERDMLESLRKVGLYCAENDYATKFYFNSPDDIKLLPPNIREMYNELMQFRKAYEICPDAYDKVHKVDGMSSINWLRKEQGKNLLGDNVFFMQEKRPIGIQLSIAELRN